MKGIIIMGADDACTIQAMLPKDDVIIIYDSKEAIKEKLNLYVLKVSKEPKQKKYTESSYEHILSKQRRKKR